MATLEQALKVAGELDGRLRERHVCRIGVFGSVARGDARIDSDVDFLVEMSPEGDLFDLVAVKSMLQERLGCSVDVVPMGGLKPDVKARILAEVRYAA